MSEELKILRLNNLKCSRKIIDKEEFMKFLNKIFLKKKTLNEKIYSVYKKSLKLGLRKSEFKIKLEDLKLEELTIDNIIMFCFYKNIKVWYNYTRWAYGKGNKCCWVYWKY